MTNTNYATIAFVTACLAGPALWANTTEELAQDTADSLHAVALQTEPVGESLSDEPAHSEGPAHWAYDGAEGPSYWGDLSADFAICTTGQEQSPVNLAHTTRAEAEAVQLYWNALADWTVSNNGHTIQASTKNGGMMTVDGQDFELLQFHFHTPSEHAIDGKRSPMEVHFVHKSSAGALAVVGVMIEGGGTNGLLDAIMVSAPASVGEADVGIRDPGELLPADPGFFRYQGSLTTPPCSETVLWTVLREPVRVSDRQIEAFQSIFAMNARPLQDVNRRFVLSD